MRIAFAILLAACAAAPPAYRITRDSGAVMVVSSYEKAVPFYRVVGRDGRRSQILAAAVAKIEPLTADELKAIEAAEVAASEAVARASTQAAYDDYWGIEPRATARTEARTAARTSARTGGPSPEYAEGLRKTAEANRARAARGLRNQHAAGVAAANFMRSSPAGFGGGLGSSLCGMPTRAGHPCQNRVAGGGPCHLHR